MILIHICAVFNIFRASVDYDVLVIYLLCCVPAFHSIHFQMLSRSCTVDSKQNCALMKLFLSTHLRVHILQN